MMTITTEPCPEGIKITFERTCAHTYTYKPGQIKQGHHRVFITKHLWCEICGASVDPYLYDFEVGDAPVCDQCVELLEPELYKQWTLEMRLEAAERATHCPKGNQ